MKKIKFFAALTFVALLAYSPLKAQNPIDPEARATERKNALTRQLGLSAEQADKVYDATLKFWSEVAAIRSGSQPHAEKRKLSQANDQVWETSLKETLTQEQYEKLLEIRKKVAEKQKAKRAGNQ